ncbi:hypothetical protein NEUTE2DRAFT_63658 [Neurospora tetrasperma FGSC 2509]|nr:hypothetical protein NEUTE2DRAFT_63658 [Neurospora tetrasperma FGSC 2509]
MGTSDGMRLRFLSIAIRIGKAATAGRIRTYMSDSECLLLQSISRRITLSQVPVGEGFKFPIISPTLFKGGYNKSDRIICLKKLYKSVDLCKVQYTDHSTCNNIPARKSVIIFIVNKIGAAQSSRGCAQLSTGKSFTKPPRGGSGFIEGDRRGILGGVRLGYVE